MQRKNKPGLNGKGRWAGCARLGPGRLDTQFSLKCHWKIGGRRGKGEAGWGNLSGKLCSSAGRRSEASSKEITGRTLKK